MLKSIQGWLGITESAPAPEQAPLRDLVNALDRLEPSRAQYLARFAYLLGRVALADEHISDEETKTMEQLLAEHGGLPAEQAMLVVSLAKATHAMFGVERRLRRHAGVHGCIELRGTPRAGAVSLRGGGE